MVFQFPTILKYNSSARFDFRNADFVLINSIIESVDWQNEFHNLSADDATEVLNCFLHTICHNLVPQQRPPKPTPFRTPWKTRDSKKHMTG